MDFPSLFLSENLGNSWLFKSCFSSEVRWRGCTPEKKMTQVQMKGGAPLYENRQMAEIKASGMVKKGGKITEGIELMPQDFKDVAFIMVYKREGRKD